MGFKFLCESCSTSNYVDKAKHKYDKYVCSNCGDENWLDSDFQLKEISLEDFNKDNEENISISTKINSKEKLPFKKLISNYKVLDSYRLIIGLMMFFYSGYGLYSFIQLSKYSNSLSNEVVVGLIGNYILIMVICLSIIKIIDLLFEIIKSKK